jgi:hypothetical protein
MVRVKAEKDTTGAAGDSPIEQARAEAAASAAAHETASGRGEARGKRGLRIPRRFKKPKPGSVPGIEPRALTQVPTVDNLVPGHAVERFREMDAARRR